MSFLDATRLTDKALLDYDDMMTEAAITVKNYASLAVNIWSEVLKELDRRGKVRLISGSCDDIGNAIIQRVA